MVDKRGKRLSDKNKGKNQEDLASHDIFDNVILKYSSLLCGLLLMVYLGYRFSKLCEALHDAQLWFSNIKEVEREISFRTESGLFYSYYKLLIKAKSLQHGLYELTHDNMTEHGVTMNVLARMNIYQEVILATVYRLGLHASIAPIYFYIRSIWLLHGGLIAGLFGISWFMAKSWLAGVLAVAYYVANMADTTRVQQTIPLRESFSMPFLWIQLLFMTLLFSTRWETAVCKKIVKAGVAVSTFFFTLFWQFNQFLLLMQCMALFGVQVLQLVPHQKIRYVFMCQAFSLVCVGCLQFGNTMIFGGMTLSFIAAAVIVMKIQTDKSSAGGLVKRVIKVAVYIISVFVFTACINKLIKCLIHVDSDEHIYKFVLHKFGISYSRDFDVKLYVCNGAFEFLTHDVFERLWAGVVLPLYTIFHIGALIALKVAIFQKWRTESQVKKSDDNCGQVSYWYQDRPELAYHVIQAVFFGCLAMTTLRMKFTWTPYMCIFGSLLVSDLHIYRYIWKLVGRSGSRLDNVMINLTRWSVTIAVIYFVYQRCWPGIQQQLDSLREFYDPDTVDLMEWIKNSTAPAASFTGSMQLLAGVKLCTERHITNHPHYEDNSLRKRTKQLYQMYARKSAEEVHRILTNYKTDYVILEDSICLAPSRDNCRLPDLMDIHNGEIPDIGTPRDGLVMNRSPRFCDEVRHMKPPYSSYFKLVFHNKTFRVYRVLQKQVS